MAPPTDRASRRSAREIRRRLHRMARRRVAADERSWPQVRDAFEARSDAADEQLAAPDGAIVSVAGAVEADADAPACPTPRARPAPTRRAPDDAGPSARRRRQIPRTLIVDRYSGCDRARPAGPATGSRYIDIRSRIVSSKAAHRVVVLEIADVLADERLPVDDQRDRVLQVGADRQDRPLDRQRRDDAWRVAARAPQHASDRARRRGPPNRRRAGRSGARRRETRRRFPPAASRVVVLDRRSARSSGWRWSSPARPARRRRTADDAAACRAASRRARRLSGATPGNSHPRRRQHDRAGRRCQQRFGGGSEHDDRRARVEMSLTISANGFSLRYFRSRNVHDRGGDCAHRTPGDSRRFPSPRRSGRRAAARRPGGCSRSLPSIEFLARSAVSSRDRTPDRRRLRMKPAIERIVVLGRAAGVERPVPHRRVSAGRRAGRGCTE